MGGDREFTVPADKAVLSNVGDLRVHESKSQVHFHADDSDLKVAVPVDRWFTAWERLCTELGAWQYFDLKTRCVLRVTVSTGGSSPCNVPQAGVVSDIVYAKLTIDKVKVDSIFEELDKFTNG